MFQHLPFACWHSPNAAAAQDSPLASPLTWMVAAHLEQTQGIAGGWRVRAICLHRDALL